ncbi:MAG: hypothetical protein ACRDTD_11125 [Pseudonocardiaceae bacterium]
MDGPLLFLVAVIGIWSRLLVLIAEQAIRKIVAWWHRRGQQGNHYPTDPAARTVEEIHCRLLREADRPARSIVIRRPGAPGAAGERTRFRGTTPGCSHLWR